MTILYRTSLVYLLHLVSLSASLLFIYLLIYSSALVEKMEEGASIWLLYKVNIHTSCLLLNVLYSPL